VSTPTLPAPLTVLVSVPAEVPRAAQARVESMAAAAGGWPDWRTAHWTVEHAPSLGSDVLALQVQVTVRPVAP
jgi:hypothetical protein